MSDLNQDSESVKNAKIFNQMAADALRSQVVQGHHFIMVPPNYSHKDISDLVEKAQPTPNRKRVSVAIKDVTSLLAYCKDQNCQDNAYIYADPDSRTLTAVFNDNKATGTGGWRDHRASYKAEYTPEFSVWMAANGKQMDQTIFGEFIEDNMADIVAPFAVTLTEVAATISAKTGIDFSSSKRLDNGQAQLTYVETIDAKAGVQGALTIPREFDLGLRIFKNGEGYKLNARLKYRLSAGAVKFWHELNRPECAVEDAFKGYIDKVRAESGYTVLMGTP